MKKTFEVSLEAAPVIARNNFLNGAGSDFSPSSAVKAPFQEPIAQQIQVAQQTRQKKKSAKEDPMTCFTFTIRSSMLTKLQELANAEQAETGESNLSLYMRVVLKRHIDKLEAAQPRDLTEQ